MPGTVILRKSIEITFRTNRPVLVLPAHEIRARNPVVVPSTFGPDSARRGERESAPGTPNPGVRHQSSALLARPPRENCTVMFACRLIRKVGHGLLLTDSLYMTAARPFRYQRRGVSSAAVN
ncbi:hypothetical protein ABIA39_009098 [Nocardia sp. GAS34]